jgi:hypothetical protein
MIPDLQTMAKALGGEVSGNSVRCPGPGHTSKDRSLSIKLEADAPDGFLVYSHAGDDNIACKDYVRQMLGLDRNGWRNKGNGHATAGKSKRSGSAIVAIYDYNDENGDLLFQVLRKEPKTFLQRRKPRPDDKPADVKGSWVWSTKGTKQVPYRLPELLAAEHDTVVVVEGEKDANNVAKLGFTATCNAGGAGKWGPELAQHFKDREVYVIPDNDQPGVRHAEQVRAALAGVAKSVRIVHLPPKFKDVSIWIEAGGTGDQLVQLMEKTANEAAPIAPEDPTPGVALDDFYALMTTHTYIYVPSREMWPASSVNARIAPVLCGDKPIPANQWLDKNRPVEQLTWMPGLPMVIEGKLVAESGWIERPGVSCFNLYKPPTIKHGNAANAGPWVDHVHKVYGDEADHIILWLAQRVQRPNEKINHALVLGGAQGIGKDTLIEPVKYAVGPWNVAEVSPQQMLGRFNGFIKSVILRISEARDLGDSDRYKFYDHLKVFTAAPPDVLRVDEKNLREHSVPNVTGVIITTNNRTDGICLPDDDRRHFVAWSSLSKEDFPQSYWNDLWGWYRNGGINDVAAYLASLDISTFNAKAPPRKTAAFWEIVDANRAPEHAELTDALDAMGWPEATTLEKIAFRADVETAIWLRDRKNRRTVPHRLDKCGYVSVRNPDAQSDGLWRVGGKRQAIYAKKTLPVRDQIAAARRQAE